MKLRKRISFVLTMCFLIIMLSACGEKGTANGNSIGKKNSPIPASEAFAQEGIWFYADEFVTKDGKINAVYVFDGNGNVTRYQTSYYDESLSFGDLRNMSSDEIIEVAKKCDKYLFEKQVKGEVNRVDYHIEKAKEDLEMASTPEAIAYAQEYLNTSEALKPKLVATEEYYKEPETTPFALKIETDGTGNQTAKEQLVFTYADIEPLEGFTAWQESWTMDKIDSWSPYADDPKKLKLSLSPTSDIITVYDMKFRGMGSIYQMVDENHPGFVLDTPDTKGVKVD